MLHTPSTTLGKLNLIAEWDISRVLEWNKTPLVTSGRTLHSLISESVGKYPDLTAIASWDGTFTYRDLDSVSKKLAHHLKALGVGPETLVAICFEKSAWAIVSMIAIMKAGGAFVPLDPAAPRERLLVVTGGIDFYWHLQRHPTLLKGWQTT